MTDKALIVTMRIGNDRVYIEAASKAAGWWRRTQTRIAHKCLRCGSEIAHRESAWKPQTESQGRRGWRLCCACIENITPADYPFPQEKKRADLGLGWAKLDHTRKWHFFGKDRKSLCGGWSAFHLADEHFTPDEYESDDDCSQCRRRLGVLYRKEGVR